MVYEARPGQTFLLGASTWRIEEIGRDRVIVTPAPGLPGAVPFWKGDGVGRPGELGAAIGAFARWAVDQKPEALERDYDLDAARGPQPRRIPARAAAGRRACCRPTARSSSSASGTRSATGGSASSRRSAAASTRPGRLALSARIRDEFELECDAIYSDDGIIIHLPDAEEPPGAELVLLEPDEVEEAVVAELGSSALFGARFRENAARALLDPPRATRPAHAPVAAATEGAVTARGRQEVRRVPDHPRDVPRMPARRARRARVWWRS